VTGDDSVEFDLSETSEEYFRVRGGLGRYAGFAMWFILVVAIVGLLARPTPPTGDQWVVVGGVLVFGVLLGVYGTFGALVHMARGAVKLRVGKEGLQFFFPSGREHHIGWGDPRIKLTIQDYREHNPGGFPFRVLFDWHPFTALTQAAFDGVVSSAKAHGLSVLSEPRSTVSYGKIDEVTISRG